MDDDQLWRQATRVIARFDKGAATYERYRPGYPAALFADLAERCRLATDNSVVVEVGAGTGLASVELAVLCSKLACLEPAAGMAAMARARLEGFDGAAVVEATFEEWEPTVAEADLVCGANAWHWVDPSVRWAKAASLLRPGGHLALVAHDLVGYEPAGFDRRLVEVGTRWNPLLAATPQELGLDGPEVWAARVQASGYFDDVVTTRYRFSRRLDGPTFAAVLNTYGVNRALDEAERRELDLALVNLIDTEFGGEVVRYEDAVLQTARRLA